MQRGESTLEETGRAERVGQISKPVGAVFGLPSMHLEHHGWERWREGEKNAKEKYFDIQGTRYTPANHTHAGRQAWQPRSKKKEERSKTNDAPAPQVT